MQPAPGDLLDHRGRRREHARPAFWSHAEVSQSAASAAGSAPPIDEAEVAAAARRRQPGLGVARELLDHLRAGRSARRGSGTSNAPAARRSSRRAARGLVERLEVLDPERGRTLEQLALGHPGESTLRDSARRAPAPVSAASTRITSQIGSGRGSSADGIFQSTVPRFQSCSFQASCVMFTAP